MRELRATQLLFHGERLTLGRKWRGITKRELAGLIGTTAAAVSQFEGGHARPRPETLASLALALQVAPTFFARRHSIPRVVEDEWHFRSLRATKKRDRARVLAQTALLAELVTFLEQFVQLPLPDLPGHFGDDLSHEAIERHALALRDLWSLGAGPIAKVVMLLEAKGCVVTRVTADSELMDAFSGRIGHRPFVVLAADKSDTARSRFDAAHELGHLLLHHDVNPGSLTAEKQAHYFAACFLMPRDVIAEELPLRANLADYFELKARWRVSVQALLYRARQVGRLSEPAFRRAMAELAAQGWRRAEPGYLGPAEVPTVVAETVALVRHARGLGRDEIAREFHIRREDLDALIGDAQPTPLALGEEATADADRHRQEDRAVINGPLASGRVS